MSRDQVSQCRSGNGRPDGEQDIQVPSKSALRGQDTQNPVRRERATDAEQSVCDDAIGLATQNSPGD